MVVTLPRQRGSPAAMLFSTPGSGGGVGVVLQLLCAKTCEDHMTSAMTGGVTPKPISTCRAESVVALRDFFFGMAWLHALYPGHPDL